MKPISILKKSRMFPFVAILFCTASCSLEEGLEFLFGGYNFPLDYPSVQIGNQVWMSEDLTITYFRNGELIPFIYSNDEWSTTSSSAFSYQSSSQNYKAGNLYNWYAVTDPRMLCPYGWRMPTAADWTQLITYLGGEEEAGIKLKNTFAWGIIGNGNNSSGFTALPGGYRDANGSFQEVDHNGYWWSSSEKDNDQSYGYAMVFNNNTISRISDKKRTGFCVRCIRDF